MILFCSFTNKTAVPIAAFLFFVALFSLGEKENNTYKCSRYHTHKKGQSVVILRWLTVTLARLKKLLPLLK